MLWWYCLDLHLLIMVVMLRFWSLRQRKVGIVPRTSCTGKFFEAPRHLLLRRSNLTRSIILRGMTIIWAGQLFLNEAAKVWIIILAGRRVRLSCWSRGLGYCCNITWWVVILSGAAARRDQSILLLLAHLVILTSFSGWFPGQTCQISWLYLCCLMLVLGLLLFKILILLSARSWLRGWRIVHTVSLHIVLLLPRLVA